MSTNTLAFEALEKGGNLPCILNASNELGVQAFIDNRISIVEISDVIEQCMDQIDFIVHPDLSQLAETDRLTRIRANEIIQKKLTK